MRRSWHIWIGFAVCLAVVLAAMGWISFAALRLDSAQLDADRQAALEENVHVSLWRMDSLLTPLVTGESARPYFAYSAFVPVNKAFVGMFNVRNGSEALIASPLLGGGSVDVLVYFQFEPEGQLTSPQLPAGPNYKLAVPTRVSEKAVEDARQELQRLDAIVDRGKLLALLPEPTSEPVNVLFNPLVQTIEQQFDNRQRRYDLQQRAGQGAVELDERNKAFFQAQNTVAGNWSINNDFNLDPSLPSTDISGVLMTPLWIDGQLILARRVAVRGSEYVQGCVLNWPGIKTTLLETIEDLLPTAQLVPVLDDSGVDHSRQLAALPLRLVPGELPISTAGTVSPIRFSLAIVWICVLLAAAAVAVLLAGVVRLSERRASFVTAVTHELRTPLTTFQIYTEMLAEDMVSDEDQRRGYLNTLRLEAVRLTHMVENVLSYARLEGGRSDGRLETVPLRDLIERIQPRLSERAAGAGMQFVVEEDGVVEETLVHTNVSAAEQVLFNLVDNACKYAAGADDKRIHLAASSENGTTGLTVRDHGPGISPAQRKLLFQAFSKTAHEAARTAPGIGLGLALSRRLSRDMGGDLQLDETAGEGASFVFTLAKA